MPAPSLARRLATTVAVAAVAFGTSYAAVGTAGAAHLRYPRFALASVLGAVAWSSVWVGAGAGLAASGLLNSTPLVVATVAGVLVAAVAVRVIRRRRRPTVPADPGALEALGERVPEPTCVG